MSPRTRRILVRLAEFVLAVGLIGAVGWHFRNILKGIDPAQLRLNPRFELLVPAGVLYLLAHLCWSTFWVRMLHFEGVNVPWGIGLRTYYISQFGKYVPGKILVPLMRMAMLRRHGAHPVPVAVTAVYETLTSMAAGALLGVLFLPALGVLPPEIAGKTTVGCSRASRPADRAGGAEQARGADRGEGAAGRTRARCRPRRCFSWRRGSCTGRVGTVCWR